MNPKHCVSLELAKELKAQGFPQNTEFYWFHSNISTFQLFSKKEVEAVVTKNKIDSDDYQAFAAPLCSELGEWIAKSANEWAQGWNSSDCSFFFTFGPKGSGNMLEGVGENFWSFESNEVNARAKMLLFLAKEGLLDPKTLQ